jgi:type IV pilus assembly protein PilA
MAKRIRCVHPAFTLVELVIVVAIVSIPASGAIAQVPQDLIRARWANVLRSVAPVQAAVGKCVQSHHGKLETGACDTTANLVTAGFLPAQYRLPAVEGTTPAYGMTPGTLVALGGAQLGNCMVTLQAVIDAESKAVKWIQTVTGEGCTEDTVALKNPLPYANPFSLAK